ncbi:hypothetical protein CBR_g40576 [Chara braunii]|uniref:Reverse transcriptase/retrotransposon-derived protein RNase H-like domain-containing protein n=1 Tax=Chara braunii TaxID=69332 RepID=A0A388K278_CHABU|nr:hypothetical protein CBR_g40576 [Chara braunii]|eukprot:GBG64129.1 hypothetical protein CBR_g40576 [Chara braunii]
MRTQPVLSGALKRWIEVIEQYDFEPRYIKGEYNKVADALSRRPDFRGALITEFGLADNITQSLVEAYRKDPFMAEIIRRLEAKDKVTSDEFVLVDALLFLEKAGNKLVGAPPLAQQNRRRKQRKEKKEAKKKTLMEEQGAKLRKIEEEMARERERLRKEQEEKLKAVEEEEEVEEQLLERRRRGQGGESSGTKEDQMEKKIMEWVAGLSLGEEEEALMYVPREEQEAAMKEWDAEEDPLKRQAIEDEKRMEWKFRLTRERKRRMESASQAAKELAEVKKQREQMATQVDLLGKMEIMARNIERLAQVQEEQYLFGRGQDIALRSIRPGLRDFTRELATQVGSEVRTRLEGMERYCTDAIEGVRLTAPKEEEARPHREPVKVKFPDSYSWKKEENFDNWEANIKTYVHLQKVSPDEHVLIAIHTLREAAASFARSLCRATNCNDDLVAYSAFTPLNGFLKLLCERFADVSRNVKASDRLQTIHSWQWKSARALKGVMDELVAIPDHGVTETQLVNLFYRAMPEQLRGHFFEKSQQATMTYDALSREVVAFKARSMSISTFWHKDLDKGKKWKGRTISGQVKTNDHLILTLDEGGVDEVPYEQIEWGLEEEDIGVSQGRTYAVVVVGGRPQGGGRGHGQGGRASGGRSQGDQGVGGRRGNHQAGGRGQGPPQNRSGNRSPNRGLANYNRKFVRNFSTIAAPLRRLMKKEPIWKWDKNCMSAMKKLKQAVIEYPILKVVDPSLPFVVTADASQYGIGVVLQQDNGNGYRPVEFMSARMPSEKVATSTYKRELYALRQALEHWKHYLLGRHFKVCSDHETLRWLRTQAKMTPKLTRWAAEVDQYDFELKPVKGKYNVVADALSRRADYFGAIVHYLDIGRDLQQKVREAYVHDPIYSDLLKRLKEAPKTEPDYHNTEGLLFEKTNVADRLCVPNNEEIRSLILGECHDTEGHFGRQKTLANLMHAYTCPGMKNDCIECQLQQCAAMSGAN